MLQIVGEQHAENNAGAEYNEQQCSNDAEDQLNEGACAVQRRLSSAPVLPLFRAGTRTLSCFFLRSAIALPPNERPGRPAEGVET